MSTKRNELLMDLKRLNEHKTLTLAKLELQLQYLITLLGMERTGVDAEYPIQEAAEYIRLELSEHAFAMAKGHFWQLKKEIAETERRLEELTQSEAENAERPTG